MQIYIYRSIFGGPYYHSSIIDVHMFPKNRVGQTILEVEYVHGTKERRQPQDREKPNDNVPRPLRQPESNSQKHTDADDPKEGYSHQPQRWIQEKPLKTMSLAGAGLFKPRGTVT